MQNDMFSTYTSKPHNGVLPAAKGSGDLTLFPSDIGLLTHKTNCFDIITTTTHKTRIQDFVEILKRALQNT